MNCKHKTALIFWLLRRAEEPSPTDVACYWKKATLSTIKNIKSKTVDELSNRNTNLNGSNNCLLKEFIEIGKTSNCDAGVIRYSEYGIKPTLYMDHLIICFIEKYGNVDKLTCHNFLSFCKEEMTNDVCEKIRFETEEQAAKNQWYHVRFARITASKLFEVSRCNTHDGSLVGSLMGSRGFKGNAATLRGQKLELQIFQQLKETKYPTITKCGIILRGDMPIFGASPDGIDDEYIFEIKCPSKRKTLSNYILNGTPKEKVFYQMQLQMAMSGRCKGILVVADPAYEINKRLTEVEVTFDKSKVDAIVEKCEKFWKQTIFPLLK